METASGAGLHKGLLHSLYRERVTVFNEVSKGNLSLCESTATPSQQGIEILAVLLCVKAQVVIRNDASR